MEFSYILLLTAIFKAYSRLTLATFTSLAWCYTNHYTWFDLTGEWLRLPVSTRLQWRALRCEVEQLYQQQMWKWIYLCNYTTRTWLYLSWGIRRDVLWDKIQCKNETICLKLLSLKSSYVKHSRALKMPQTINENWLRESIRVREAEASTVAKRN